jgi:hypothetical protein
MPSFRGASNRIGGMDLGPWRPVSRRAPSLECDCQHPKGDRRQSKPGNEAGPTLVYRTQERQLEVSLTR